jgi:hypothetical protein
MTANESSEMIDWNQALERAAKMLVDRAKYWRADGYGKWGWATVADELESQAAAIRALKSEGMVIGMGEKSEQSVS